MKKFVSIFCCLCFSIAFFAQDNVFLKAEGEIPEEFITPSASKYKKEVKEWAAKRSKKAKGRDKRNQKQFLLESNFAIDNILQSGLVLFNDPATVYVNKVLSQLPVSEDKKLKSKRPRAYVLNSGAVNAFATDQGIIFVTLGLLANLQNEAQLAFILSHELVHVKHQHSIDKFVKSKNIARNNSSKNIDDLGIDRNVFSKSLYSQKLEEEADEEGLEIFLKTDYDPQAILNTFTILHYSYLPFEDFPVDKSFFEDENYVFPDHIWLNKVRSISPMNKDEETDRVSSHPSSLKRLEKLKARINNADQNNKRSFIVSESEFQSIQTKARYQIPFLNLFADNYAEAIYTAYLLLEQYPDDFELKKVIGKALYMEAKYQNYEAEEGGNRNREMEGIRTLVEGESHKIYYLLSKMDQAEVTVLATKYNWQLHQQYPDDEELALLVKDVFKELAYNFKNLGSFSTTALPVQIKDTLSTLPLTIEIDKNEKVLIDSAVSMLPPVESLSKLEKIKISNEMQSSDKDSSIVGNSSYQYYAFVDELQTESFQAAYKKGLEEYEEEEERIAYYESEEGKSAWKKTRKHNNKHGKKLGINKVVVVNPFYLSLDFRSFGDVEYIRSEEKQSKFRESIKKIATISSLDATVLDVADLSTQDIEKFNDIIKVNQYFSQQMGHYDFSLTPGYQQNEINDIAKKYGTDFFLWTGVISFHEKHNGWGGYYAAFLLPYTIPFSIANLFTPQYDTMYYAILFDIKTGRRSIIKMDYFNKRDSNTVLQAHIYDVFFQIEQSDGKKK